MSDVKTICISHGDDPDGLICAAYLRLLKGASTILIDYNSFEDTLRNLASPTAELFICDLNIRENLVKEILRISKFTHVTIVDHHPIPAEIFKELKRSGVTLAYSLLDCASALLYDHFRDKLTKDAARLAAYAAISDQLEDGPIASELLTKFDRQLVQHEALILNHALHHRKEVEFKSLIVEELSRLTFPHRIKGVTDAALTHLERMAELIEVLPKAASKLKDLAYFEAATEISTGAVAGLVIDALDVDVGVCYKKVDAGRLNLSIRGRRGLKVHLGELTKSLAKKYNGSGGGHSGASGAIIPEQSLPNFILDLERELERAKNPQNTIS